MISTPPAKPNALLSRIAHTAATARPTEAAPRRANEPHDHVCETTLPADGVMIDIPIERLERDPGQPRKIFNQAKLQALADNLKELGQISALSVYPPAVKGGLFVISAGERRWRAAKLAGFSRLRCIVVRRGTDPRRVLVRAIADNLQREDLQPIEEARSYRELVEMGMTQKEIAASVGVKPPRISESLAILNLSDDVLKEAEELNAPAQVLLHLSRADDATREELLARLRRGETVKRSDARQARKKAPSVDGAGEGRGTGAASTAGQREAGANPDPQGSGPEEPLDGPAAGAKSPAVSPAAPPKKATPENTRAYEITYSTLDGVRVTIATADVSTARRALRFGLESFPGLQPKPPKKSK